MMFSIKCFNCLEYQYHVNVRCECVGRSGSVKVLSSGCSLWTYFRRVQVWIPQVKLSKGVYAICWLIQVQCLAKVFIALGVFEYGTTTNLPREGRPPKLTDQARRAFSQVATKRLKITLKELQSSTAEIGVSVHGTTLNHILHSAGPYGGVA
jgi:hypothetical protein